MPGVVAGCHGNGAPEYQYQYQHQHQHQHQHQSKLVYFARAFLLGRLIYMEALSKRKLRVARKRKRNLYMKDERESAFQLAPH
jgi:hypothetical protein